MNLNLNTKKKKRSKKEEKETFIIFYLNRKSEIQIKPTIELI